MFGSRVGFSRLADRMALFPVTSNPSWRQAAILDNFKWPYLRNGSFDPLIKRASRGHFAIAQLSCIRPLMFHGTNPRSARGMLISVIAE